MESYTVKIKSIIHLTHDVIQLVTTKPYQYSFIPGQATDVSINKKGWDTQKRPFTFTSLPEYNYLEFTIKTYPEHKGMTNELLQLKKEDELLLHSVFGAIAYKGEGVFIAGGAGITPFLSIFKHLHAQNSMAGNQLIFANKTRADIVLEQLLKKWLGAKFINILSDEKLPGYANGLISEAFMKANCQINDQLFYLCGPPKMMASIEKQLQHLQVTKSNIIKEVF